VVEAFRPLADESGVAVVRRGEGRAEADPERTRQVLFNLLSNALRHSPPGGEVEVRVEPGEGEVWVWVCDQGPGVPPEAASRVFEPFVKLGHGQGSGLGLAVVKALVGAQGGRVELRENRPRGACFGFSLPRAQ